MSDLVRSETSGVGPSVFAVKFSGTAVEYFGIWIVNFSLTILTLGVYSAWAKVRTRRYFYLHTEIDEHSFEYDADPVAILKGYVWWVLAILALGLAVRLQSLNLVLVVIALGLPWALVRRLEFDLSHTSYRGVRFGFRRDDVGLYWMVLRSWFLVCLTFGLLLLGWPLWLRRFVVPRTRFGSTDFVFTVPTDEYNLIFVRAFGLLFALGVAAGLVAYIALSGFAWMDVFSMQGFRMALWSLLFGAVFYLLVLLIWLYVYVSIANLFWNSVRLGSLRFRAEYRGIDLFLVTAQNILACVFTFGLAWPWVAIEWARYRASGLKLLGSTEDFNFSVPSDHPHIG